MSQQSAIEWTEATWNCLAGCSEISPGCTNCYAAVMAHRLEAMGQRKYAGTTRKAASGKVVWTGKINLDEDALQIPLKRKKPTVYFVNSMSDLFHGDVPDEFIDKVFAVMALCPQHTFQVLTKRAERMKAYFTKDGWHDARHRIHAAAQRLCSTDIDGKIPAKLSAMHDKIDWIVPRELWGQFPVESLGMEWPLPNVWLGVSVEDQQRADERMPHLLQTPAAVRFLSCEPLLGPVDLEAIRIPLAGKSYMTRSALCGTDSLNKGAATLGRDQRIDWVIVGGESGHGARPFIMDWGHSIIQQCKAAGVAVFMKQVGSNPMINANLSAKGISTSAWGPITDPKGGAMEEWPLDLRVREMPKSDVHANR